MPADIQQALQEVGFDRFNASLKDFMKNYDQMKEEQREANAAGGSMKRGLNAISNAAMEVHEVE